MKCRGYICLVLLSMVLASDGARANDYASNRVYVKSSPNGQCYAKGIPADLYGSSGVTKIYYTREGEDILVDTYSWYAQQIDLQVTQWGISVVRLGTWHRGQNPNATDLAIGFYLAGKVLKEYSTFDFANMENRSSDAIPYAGITKLNGYEWVLSRGYTFDVEAGNGKRIFFDIRTGALEPRQRAHKR